MSFKSESGNCKRFNNDWIGYSSMDDEGRLGTDAIRA